VTHGPVFCFAFRALLALGLAGTVVAAPRIGQIDLAPASISRTSCVTLGREAGSAAKFTAYRVESVRPGNPAWPLYTLTNGCSDNVVVFAAACMDTTMASSSPGESNVPAYRAGQQAGVTGNLSSGGALRPGEKMILGYEGDSPGMWNRHPQRTTLNQAVWGAISYDSYVNADGGKWYKDWKDTAWRALNAARGASMPFQNMGASEVSFPNLWKGNSCGQYDLGAGASTAQPVRQAAATNPAPAMTPGEAGGTGSASIEVGANCTNARFQASIPDGKTATREEMATVMKQVNQYQSDVTAYLACMKSARETTMSSQAALTAAQKSQIEQAYVSKGDAAYDALESVVGRFNEQLRTFKARTAK
jgi:hypothetical protein